MRPVSELQDQRAEKTGHPDIVGTFRTPGFIIRDADLRGRACPALGGWNPDAVQKGFSVVSEAASVEDGPVQVFPSRRIRKQDPAAARPWNLHRLSLDDDRYDRHRVVFPRSHGRWYGIQGGGLLLLRVRDKEDDAELRREAMRSYARVFPPFQAARIGCRDGAGNSGSSSESKRLGNEGRSDSGKNRRS